jgi:asparagine synthetase B (glutamine-hydrolysing)
VIAGLVARRTHDLAVRSIRTLSGAAPDPDACWRSTGEPLVWLAAPHPLARRIDGQAPLSSRPVVAFAGHLYDGHEPGSLADRSSIARSASPAETIAGRWPTVGPALLDHLVGEFALALWDPAARELVLATEPMGQVPLYYVESPDGTMLAFASRTRSLRALDWIGSEPDDESIVAALVNVAPRPGATFFRRIRQLPGGHRLRWRDGRIDVARYWGPRFAQPDIRSTDEMLEAFEHTVRAAVAARLDPARPTAILMSGGYDSTAVAGAVAALCRERPDETPRVAAISATFGDLPCDESWRIDIALAETGLTGLRTVPLGRGIDPDAMRRHVARHDAPFVDFQAPLLDACATLAREHGFATLMTGLGGDELATDFDYHVDFARAMGPWRFPETVRRVAAIEKLSCRRAALWLLRELCPEYVKRPYRAMRGAVSPRTRSGTADDWLEPAARRMAEHLRARPAPAPVGFDSHTAEVRWRTATSPVVEVVRHWFTVELAGEGFALANPLLDRRLFELVFATNARFHPRSSDRGEYKPLIARGLPFVPRRLVGGYWKAEFGSYNAHVLQQSLGAIDDWLFGSGTWRAERFVARETAVRTLDRFRDEPLRLHYRVEAIVGLETWLRSLEERA